MIKIEHSANVFGRIATLSGVYGIDAARLLDRLTPLTPELSDLALVAVPNTFDRMSVIAQVGRDAIARVFVDADLEQARRVGVLAGGSDTRAAVIEMTTTPNDRERVALSVQTLGRRDLATDLARLASFDELPIETARAVATALGGDHLIGVTDRGDRTWTLQIEQPNATATQRAATRERADRAAALLGVTRAQRDLVAGLHDALAKDHDSYALVHLRKERVALAVMWGVVAWEHVIRIMLQLYRGDVARQLGELAGATGGDDAAMVEIVLGTSEPPAMRVAAAIAKGRT